MLQDGLSFCIGKLKNEQISNKPAVIRSDACRGCASNASREGRLWGPWPQGMPASPGPGRGQHSSAQPVRVTGECEPRVARASDFLSEAGNLDFYVESPGF